MRGKVIAVALGLWMAGCGTSPPPVAVGDSGPDGPADVPAADVASPDATGDQGAPPEDARTPTDRVDPADVTLDVPVDVPGADVATADAGCGAASQGCCAGAPRCADGLACTAEGVCLPCGDGQTACAGVCVDTSVSATNCGACGRACADGELCSEGSCRGVCPAPGTLCGAGCVRTATDANHCGRCGNRCSLPNAVAGCDGGACVVAACSDGFGDCDGMSANGCETDLRTSVNRCGTCATACPGGASATCAMGACGLSCPANFGDCDRDPSNGCETNLLINPNHCARCGNECPATAGGATCAAGACGSSSCAAGTADCDGTVANGCETSLATSTMHCGACGRACALPHATAACARGACAVLRCDDGYGDCDADPSNGCEVELSTATDHCGRCGNACAGGPGATPACVAGACAIAACDPGTASCDGMVANGCETNTNTSTTHCGSCGAACAFNHAAASCAGGACAMGACSAPYADCNGVASDGCEVNTNASVANCGGCGQRCALARVDTHTCVMGACGIGACRAGYANCDGTVANGCETNTNTSSRHCGACGRACAATEVCSLGACRSSCAAGLTGCGSSCVNLQTDAANCGTCGRACSLANATAACSAGGCVVASCNAGFADCDGNPANGCEVNTNTSTANCGACGRACAATNGTATCAAGVCGIRCAAGFGNCDGNASNGCEANLQTNPSNCGACGSVCSLAHATSTCSGGACAIGMCVPLSVPPFATLQYRNCDGNAANGCETAITTNVNNCGSCGTVCPSRPHASARCSGGSCGFRCNSDYADCDGNASNGCEVHTTDDVRNCGGCGNRCFFGFACVRGTCF